MNAAHQQLPWPHSSRRLRNVSSDWWSERDKALGIEQAERTAAVAIELPQRGHRMTQLLDRGDKQGASR
jgi:hypothetical protein